VVVVAVVVTVVPVSSPRVSSPTRQPMEKFEVTNITAGKTDREQSPKAKSSARETDERCM
jgi:hypothetical protein